MEVLRQVKKRERYRMQEKNALYTLTTPIIIKVLSSDKSGLGEGMHSHLGGATFVNLIFSVAVTNIQFVSLCFCFGLLCFGNLKLNF